MNKLKTIVIVVSAVLLVACGEDNAREISRKKVSQKAEQVVKQREAKISAIEQKFNAIRFPPKGFNTSAYTYVIQKYFMEQKSKPHLFSGTVTDVVKSGKGYRVIIQSNLGNAFFSEIISLNLIMNSDMLSKLPLPTENIFRRYNLSHHWFLSRITAVNAVTRTETNINGDRDHVSSDSILVRSLILSGDLVSIIKKKKKKK
ncbi:hypothetical protein N9748_00785 [bacterium]|nr:hypothetical protein [bacterium]